MPASPTATYPAALDSPQAPSQFDSLATDGVEHDYVHDWAIDAIKKIEAKLGITSSPDVTSVDYVLKNHQHQGTDRSAQIARLPIKMVASQSLAPVEVQNNLGTILSAITAAGEFLDIGATAATLAFRSYVAGDATDRFQVQADGKVLWGAGTVAPDVTLARTSASTLTLTGNLSITNPLPIASGGTGSTTKNFVDLTTAQTIAGVKTFSSAPVFSAPLALASGGTGSTTKNFVDLTTAQTAAGAKTFSGLLAVQAGLSVLGSPSGYTNPYGEVTGGSLALTTTAAAPSTMFFDHRGTANAGDWAWRNGTIGGTTRMILDANGKLTLGTSGLYVTPSAAMLGANFPLFVNVPTGSTADLTQWQVNGSGVARISSVGGMYATGPDHFFGPGALSTGKRFRIGNDATWTYIQGDDAAGGLSQGNLHIDSGSIYMQITNSAGEWRLYNSTSSYIGGVSGGGSSHFMGADHLFGAHALGAAGSQIHLGSLGDLNAAYIIAEGSGASTNLVLHASGSGSAGITDIQDVLGNTIAQFKNRAAAVSLDTSLSLYYNVAGGARFSNVTVVDGASVAGSGRKFLSVPA